MKNLLKKNLKRIGYIFGIVTIASILGFSIHFARAVWTPPTQTAPNGNVAAPITTSDVSQAKKGSLTVDKLKLRGISAIGYLNDFRSPQCACDTDNFANCSESSNFGDVMVNNGDTCYDRLRWDFGLGAINLSLRYVLTDSSNVTSEGIAFANGVKISSDGITLAQSGLGKGVKFQDGSTQDTALEADVADNICSSLVGTECKQGYYLRGPSKCCPFNSKLAAGSGTWSSVATIDYTQSDPDWAWATKQTKTFSVPAGQTVSAVRVSGYADDGGYCYAYWSDDHVESYRHDPNTGIYSEDNSLHAGVQQFSSDDWQCTGSGATYDYLSGICTISDPCPSIASFDNSGNAKICQANSNDGSIPAASKTGLRITATRKIYLQGRHTIGRGSDKITCNLEVQY